MFHRQAEFSHMDYIQIQHFEWLQLFEREKTSFALSSSLISRSCPHPLTCPKGHILQFERNWINHNIESKILPQDFLFVLLICSSYSMFLFSSPEFVAVITYNRNSNCRQNEAQHIFSKKR